MKNPSCGDLPLPVVSGNGYGRRKLSLHVMGFLLSNSWGMINYKDPMKKIKEILIKLNNRKLIITILLILIVGSSFYWFQFRPSKIYSNCHKASEKLAKISYKNDHPYNEDGVYLKDDYEFIYKQCLRLKGINK